MINEAMLHAFFDEYAVMPAEQTAQRIFWSLSNSGAFADSGSDTMAHAFLVATLVSLCTRELQRYLKTNDETLVWTHVHCHHGAPIPAGSRIRMTGWVERLRERDVTFRVKAQDEQEQVYGGCIKFAIVRRAEMALLISRKRDAIARRELFAPA
jgi:fluoroacetyl-CoA thioesterase